MFSFRALLYCKYWGCDIHNLKPIFTQQMADEGSAGLRFHERLSDKETVKTGQNSCDQYVVQKIDSIKVTKAGLSPA